MIADELQVIRRTLWKNDVGIVKNGYVINNLKNLEFLANSPYTPRFAQLHMLNVYPSEEIPLNESTSEKLREFMRRIVIEIENKGIECEKVRPFIENYPFMRVGNITYVEKIGEMLLKNSAAMVQIRDDRKVRKYNLCSEVDKNLGYNLGNGEIESFYLNRKIVVRPFPNEELAERYRNSFYIGKISLNGPGH